MSDTPTKVTLPELTDDQTEQLFSEEVDRLLKWMEDTNQPRDQRGLVIALRQDWLNARRTYQESRGRGR